MTLRESTTPTNGRAFLGFGGLLEAAPLSLGAATWTVLGLLPALASRHTLSAVGCVPALGALGWMARSMALKGPEGSRSALMAGAVGFPLALGVGALATGAAGRLRVDTVAQVVGALTALAYAASLARWAERSGRRAKVVTLALEESSTAPTPPPPARVAALIVLGVLALGVGVLLPLQVLESHRGAGLGPVDPTALGRRALVLATGLVLSLSLVLAHGPRLVRRASPKARASTRAVWLLTGALAAFAMRLWLERAR